MIGYLDLKKCCNAHEQSRRRKVDTLSAGSCNSPLRMKVARGLPRRSSTRPIRTLDRPVQVRHGLILIECRGR